MPVVWRRSWIRAMTPAFFHFPFVRSHAVIGDRITLAFDALAAAFGFRDL
jgi:hypothetical protein